MTFSQQFCTFHLDGLLFGVPVEQVQEVIRSQPMTRGPLAPPAVAGLINLRGQVVTAIDLRTRLNLESREEETQPINVVVQNADGAVSFLVDEIGDVQSVDQDAFEPPPSNLAEPLKSMVRGVYKLSSKVMLVLDAERALDVAA